MIASNAQCRFLRNILSSNSETHIILILSTCRSKNVFVATIAWSLNAWIIIFLLIVISIFKICIILIRLSTVLDHSCASIAEFDRIPIDFMCNLRLRTQKPFKRWIMIIEIYILFCCRFHLIWLFLNFSYLHIKVDILTPNRRLTGMGW